MGGEKFSTGTDMSAPEPAVYILLVNFVKILSRLILEWHIKLDYSAY